MEIDWKAVKYYGFGLATPFVCKAVVKGFKMITGSDSDTELLESIEDESEEASE